MATVHLSGRLRELGPGPVWTSSAETVAGLLDELEHEFPPLREKFRDGSGEIRRSVVLFVNGEDVRNGAGRRTPLKADDRVEILPATPGG